MDSNSTLLDTEKLTEFLFHYTSKETALEHIIPSRELLMGRYQETNDPRESKRWNFLVSGSGGEHNFPDAAIDSWDTIARVQKNLRVLCLTTDHTDEPMYAPPEVRGFGPALVMGRDVDREQAQRTPPATL